MSVTKNNYIVLLFTSHIRYLSVWSSLWISILIENILGYLSSSPDEG